jgi:hypothetical protein
MSDADDALRGLRERLAGSGDDRLGKALSELLENPLFTGAVTRAFDARELAVHAQEMALAMLNIPSAADIERLTRRLRAMSQRLEGVEDALFRMEGALAGGAVDARLSRIEDRLAALLEQLAVAPGAASPTAPPASPPTGSSAPSSPARRAGRPPRRSPTEAAGDPPATETADPAGGDPPPDRPPGAARRTKAKEG